MSRKKYMSIFSKVCFSLMFIVHYEADASFLNEADADVVLPLLPFELVGMILDHTIELAERNDGQGAEQRKINRLVGKGFNAYFNMIARRDGRFNMIPFNRLKQDNLETIQIIPRLALSICAEQQYSEPHSYYDTADIGFQDEGFHDDGFYGEDPWKTPLPEWYAVSGHPMLCQPTGEYKDVLLELANLMAVNFFNLEMNDSRFLNSNVNLQHVQIVSPCHLDMNALSCLVNLKTLVLSVKTVCNCEAINKLVALEALLVLVDMEFEFSIKSGLNNLKFVLYGGTLNSIGFVNHLKNLEFFSFKASPDTDLSPLSKLAKLKLLMINGMGVRNVPIINGTQKVEIYLDADSQSQKTQEYISERAMAYFPDVFKLT